jgi:hypothetical protein
MVGIGSAMMGQWMTTINNNDWHASVVDRVESSQIESSQMDDASCIDTVCATESRAHTVYDGVRKSKSHRYFCRLHGSRTQIPPSPS